MRVVKTCSISGQKFEPNDKNFYYNRNTPDKLHPYHKFYDNMRRTHGISVETLRKIINFKNQ